MVAIVAGAFAIVIVIAFLPLIAVAVRYAVVFDNVIIYEFFYTKIGVAIENTPEVVANGIFVSKFFEIFFDTTDKPCLISSFRYSIFCTLYQK